VRFLFVCFGGFKGKEGKKKGVWLVSTLTFSVCDLGLAALVEEANRFVST